LKRRRNHYPEDDCSTHRHNHYPGDDCSTRRRNHYPEDDCSTHRRNHYPEDDYPAHQRGAAPWRVQKSAAVQRDVADRRNHLGVGRRNTDGTDHWVTRDAQARNCSPAAGSRKRPGQQGVAPPEAARRRLAQPEPPEPPEQQPGRAGDRRELSAPRAPAGAPPLRERRPSLCQALHAPFQPRPWRACSCGSSPRLRASWRSAGSLRSTCRGPWRPRKCAASWPRGYWA
jgi:hypothetical protein